MQIHFHRMSLHNLVQIVYRLRRCIFDLEPITMLALTGVKHIHFANYFAFLKWVGFGEQSFNHLDAQK